MSAETPALPADVRLALIDQEIGEWRKNQFMIDARHRVNTRLGNLDVAKACEAELVKCDMYLTAWAEERAKVESEKNSA